MDMQKKHTVRWYAIRETTYKGKYCYELCLVSIKDTNYNGRCRYSETFDLRCARKEFAIKKAHRFFSCLCAGCINTIAKFYGIIKDNEFKGEPASINEKCF